MSWFKTGDADAVGELAALCVKGKRERVAPRLYAYAHVRIRKLPGISVVSVITTCNTRTSYMYKQSSSTPITDRFYGVSYFITPF